MYHMPEISEVSSMVSSFFHISFSLRPHRIVRTLTDFFAVIFSPPEFLGAALILAAVCIACLTFVSGMVSYTGLLSFKNAFLLSLVSVKSYFPRYPSNTNIWHAMSLTRILHQWITENTLI